jgi:probable phosphoglycerate mutase
MPILLLTRHATNDFVKTGRLPGHSPNIHLNADGRAQAAALGAMLASRKLNAVYASHLERAIETAFRVAAPHGLPIHIRPGLADIDNGTFTAKTIKELSEGEETKALWKTVVDTPSLAVFPEGEGMLAMQARIVAALEAICAAHPDLPVPPKPGDPEPVAPTTPVDPAAPPPEPPKMPQTIAVVMHADPIKAAVAHYLGMPFDNFQRVGTSPASVTTVMVHEKGAMVLSLNITA